MSKTWEEKLTNEEKGNVIKELHNFGLDNRQINSLMKIKGKADELELIMMRDLPRNRYGRKATISSVRDILGTMKKLKLITTEGGG